MVRRRLFQGKFKKALEGNPVVDLAFQFRVGLDLKPFLKQETFE